jgi:uncharacterized membrane protein YfcA
MTVWDWLLLLGGGLLAGVANTLAGGGSLITVPLLVMVGLPPNVANGTNRIGILIQSLVASATFHGKGVSGVRSGLALLPVGLAGALGGAYLGTALSDESFRRIFGLIMIPLAAVSLMRRKTPTSEAAPAEPSARTWRLQVAYFFVGAWAGFIQAGVGLIALAVLSAFGGFDLKRGNAIKVVTVAAFTCLALAVFALRVGVDWGVGLVLAVASGAGGYLGSVAALKQGDRLVRVIFVLACVGLSARMLFG